MNKIDLRNQFEKTTGKVATDHIADYADWLEENLLSKMNQITIKSNGDTLIQS